MARSDGSAGPRRLSVTTVAELTTILQQASVATGRPVIVLVGGASEMSDSDVDALATVLARSVFPVLGPGGAVVDGGTDAGVMRAAGRARVATHEGLLLVGVAAKGTVAVPDGSSTSGDAADLDPGHTHVLIVPGEQWGDESPWLNHVAAALAAGAPSATILANGGAIAARDAMRSLAWGRPIVVLGGTGRLADAVASVRADHDPDRAGDAASIARSDLTTVVDIYDLDAVRAAVAAALLRPLEGA